MRQTYDETEALKTRIVEVSREVFAEKGYAAAKMSDIAERANVSRGPLYYHFQNKQVLFEYVCSQINLTMEREIKEMFSRTDLSLSEKLYHDLMISNKYVDVVYAQEMAFLTNENEFKDLRHSFVDELERLGEFKEAELDKAYNEGLLKSPEAAGQIVQILITSYGMLIRRGPNNIKHKYNTMDVESLAEFVVEGIQHQFFVTPDQSKSAGKSE